MQEAITRCTTISDLFSKEVINTCTGERLGYVCDAEVDVECGVIRFFCLPVPCKNPFAKNREIRKFAFDDIVKIGGDTILVKSTFPCHARAKKLL